jgi:hypothetical protein
MVERDALRKRKEAADTDTAGVAGRLSKATKRRLRTYDLWWLVGGVTSLGLVVIAVGMWNASDSVELWSEITKAGIQLVGVAVLGGLLGFALKSIEEKRRESAAKSAAKAERKRQRREKLRSELAELVALYNGVKTVRRTLRSLGLDVNIFVDTKREPEKGKEMGSAICLTAHQAKGFHEQLEALNRLQLGFESKKRQFEQTNLLKNDTKQVARELKHIERKLNSFLDVWEHSGWMIREGTRLDVVSDPLQGLYRSKRFNAEIGDRLDGITKVFNRHLFEPTSGDKTANRKPKR